MGKTQSGAVWLDENKTSPFDFYQYWRNVDDADVLKCIRMLTFLPLEEIEKMEQNGTFDLLPKKEVIGLKKEYGKLNKNLRGIRDMKKIPNALIIVDPKKEEIAIKEARILGIPVFGVVDTNCDPDMVDYVIPGNDDAVRSVKLMIGVLANAIAEVNGNEMIDYLTDDDKNKKSSDKEEVAPKKEERRVVKKEEKDEENEADEDNEIEDIVE